MKPAAIIYLVTNSINGKRYVGLTRFPVRDRWRQHVYNANYGLRTYLYSAMRKYGAENFSIQPIASCLSVETASLVEREAIRSLRPEYNQTNGGEFTSGKRVPREVVERITAKNCGLKRSKEHNQRMSEIKRRQYAQRPELKQAAIERLVNARYLVDEDKRKAAAARACRNRVWSEESRAKLSASCKGRRYGPEILDKVRLKKQKSVECITLGVTFDSILEASAHLRISNSAIGRACAGIRQKTAGGMRFRYV
jgi:group I intron endonuclease